MNAQAECGAVKRKVLVIGIGPGHPDYVTMQAVGAMNRADLFFIPQKGEEKEELARVRREICERYIDRPYREVAFAVPSRRAARGGDYRDTVADWHAAVEQVYRRLLAEELQPGQCGAFLVWGDPTLYDSTIRILERLLATGGLDFDYEVIAGISAPQALAALHKVPMNNIGQSILYTTGRRLAEGFPEGADSVVVMLDGELTWKDIDGDLDVYWGAYVGLPDQRLVAGKLSEVAGEVERIRADARGAKGWLMDTTLIKRPGDGTA